MHFIQCSVEILLARVIKLKIVTGLSVKSPPTGRCKMRDVACAQVPTRIF